MATSISTPPSSPLTDFTHSPSPPSSPTFWLDISGAPEVKPKPEPEPEHEPEHDPEPVAPPPPPKRRGRPPKNKPAEHTPSLPTTKNHNVNVNLKKRSRSPSAEDTIRVATPPPQLPRKRKAEAAPARSDSPETLLSDDDQPRRKRQKKEKGKAAIAPRAPAPVPVPAPALVGTRRSSRQVKLTDKASSSSRGRANANANAAAFPTPSPTNAFGSSPSTMTSALGRRVQATKGNAASTSTSTPEEPEPERKLSVFEIDAALDLVPARPPMTMYQFLNDRRPEGGIWPATGPSATLGSRLPKIDGRNRSGCVVKSQGGSGKGKGKGKAAAKKVVGKKAVRSFGAPSFQHAAETQAQGAAMPPSTSQTQKRGRDSDDSDDSDDTPEPPPKRPRTERGSSETVELLTQPTSPAPQVAAADILYFAHGTDMSTAYMTRKYAGSEFVSCAKVSDYKWSVGVDDKVKISPSNGAATWGAIYKITPPALLALSAKATQQSLTLSTVPAQLFQRNKAVGWFGNETEAQLLAGGVVSAYVLVAQAPEQAQAQDENAEAEAKTAEKEGPLDSDSKAVFRINRAIVELCPEGLCAAYVEQTLRRWVPRPKTPDGIYW